MPRIDNEPLLQEALHIIDTANRLIAKLNQDVQQDTPEKAKTVWLITGVIEAQSTAIRRLVEQQLQINDKLNELMEKHPHLF